MFIMIEEIVFRKSLLEIKVLQRYKIFVYANKNDSFLYLFSI